MKRFAKEKKLRIWKDYKLSTPSLAIKDKEFHGKVIIFNKDSIVFLLFVNIIILIFLFCFCKIKIYKY